MKIIGRVTEIGSKAEKVLFYGKTICYRFDVIEAPWIIVKKLAEIL